MIKDRLMTKAVSDIIQQTGKFLIDDLFGTEGLLCLLGGRTAWSNPDP